MRYKLTSYFASLRFNSAKWIVFHSRLGNPAVISNDLYSYLRSVGNKRIVYLNNVLREFIQRGLLVECEEDEEKTWVKLKNKYIELAKKKQLWDMLRLSVTEKCNLSCKYCYIHKRGGESEEIMPLEIASKAINNFYINFKSNISRLPDIWFYGGEPFIAHNVIYECLKLIEHLNESSKLKPSITVITNGTIFPDRLVKKMSKMHSRLGVSLDGVLQSHDEARPFKDGSSSFATIDKNIDLFLKNGLTPTILTVLTEESADGLCLLVKYCKSKNITNINVDRVIFCDSTTENCHVIVKKLLYARELAKRLGVNLSGFWEQMLTSFLSPSCRYKYCSGLGHELNITPEGKVKLCTGYSSFVGHVDDLFGVFDCQDYVACASTCLGNLGQCDNCYIQGFCLGGCLAELGSSFGAMSSNPTHCNYYKILFKHLVLMELGQRIR